MWANAATQANVATLKSRGIHVWGPGEGDQACGETGAGRMLEPTQLAAFVSNTIAPSGPLAGKRVLLTVGPTRERIDPVRFISNRSSGKMGFAVAAAARDAGADVTVVAGPCSCATPPGVKRIEVESAADMLDAVVKNLEGVDIFVATAAVADYRPANPVECKIKKTSESMDIRMERTVDILATVAARAGALRPFVVGFAAETDSVEQYARQKLLKKNLDMIAANEVGHDKVFEKDDNALLVLWRDGRRELPQAPKVALARDLVALIAERYAQRGAAVRLTSVSA
jgi:phosphopantothenoylcysteine decarboxylase / phosphopantothenate---cysteine ligase